MEFGTILVSVALLAGLLYWFSDVIATGLIAGLIFLGEALLTVMGIILTVGLQLAIRINLLFGKAKHLLQHARVY
ncbi:hypothetical protein [Loigolactobacillus bifermentans]|jgi:hypothetical protein|uniref:Uncharacterized protein n=1 Tax=Loigolactobacillus bifermentans DSM 20003 TaxID=1423726 RepID=A0A0R1H3Q2_9LACO|nr:hypothetical protein [Loigolactobacillus bifermentans]KRK40633.1 hypothetical protein FC07_GL000042 [Loigolactobacillus bifermentans DSM 20003]QGG60692.1 hypothetical protein LB003_09585 [Loigolactobacillus bifermentans]